ncbi:MAG: hypothetical protein HYR72_11425 [Deltaproteobacteria bacterium]|nr:hypothetical protein [Deltaproteobacteria bacterium]MBI3387573.1 hypothetical protein [Deltaproteobacteria bacterium]
MRVRVVKSAVVGVALLALPQVAAAVNCEQVRKYLATGRSVEDVAETMIVSIDDVKKCQQGGEQKSDTKAAQPPAKPASKK